MSTLSGWEEFFVIPFNGEPCCPFSGEPRKILEELGKQFQWDPEVVEYFISTLGCASLSDFLELYDEKDLGASVAKTLESVKDVKTRMQRRSQQIQKASTWAFVKFLVLLS